MEDEKWEYTSIHPRRVIDSEARFRVALIDELDQLNKTLSVIASNQERHMSINVDNAAKKIQNELSESLKQTIDQLHLSDY